MERVESTTPNNAQTARQGFESVARYGARHWRMLLRVAALLLLLVVVLQNVEPTSIDLLFWSVLGVPKVILLLIAMAVGAALWEGSRRLFLTRQDRSAPPNHAKPRQDRRHREPSDTHVRGASSARQEA